MVATVRRSAKALTWLFGMGLLTTSVLAQAPQLSPLVAPAPTNKIFTRNTQFKLPVQVDDAIRVKIVELKMFVRGPAGTWSCQETASPTATSFSFKADRDGEYWFTFVTVDRAGKLNPPSLDTDPPHRVVVVDTVPPQIRVEPLTVANRDTFLQVFLTDPNPEPTSIRMSYLSGNGTWQPLELVQPDKPGIFRVPSANVLQGRVRVTASDRAGNVATRDIDLRNSSSNENSTPPLIPIPAEPLPSDLVKKIDAPRPPLLTEKSSEEPEIRPITSAARPKTIESEAMKIPDLAGPDLKLPPPDQLILLTPPTKPNPLPEAILKEPVPSKFPAPEIKPLTPVSAVEEIPASPESTSYINTTKCILNYVLENIDANTPTKMEFWATNDGGRNWAKLIDSSEGRSPAQLQLPGEGLYGIAIRSNNNGQAPTPGDKPDCWVEVDTSKPFVNLIDPTIGKDADAGTLLILWSAHDKNLKEDSINVWYATRADGPWLPVLQNHKNEGVYRWIMPNGLGAQIYLRMEATDRGGNVGRTELRKPVQLEVQQPKARVISVAPAK